MKRTYEISEIMAIHADRALIFMLMTDVEKWYLWTSSVKKARLLNGGEFQKGTRVKIWQPKLLPAVWTVTEFEPLHAFAWISTSPGLRMTARHFIKENQGRFFVQLDMVYEGVLAGFFFKLTSGLTRRYMEMEIKGLKRICEQPR